MKMTSLRMRISHLNSKKVPALLLVLVGIVGMVAGVLAATIVVNTTTYNFTGESGTLHQSSGLFAPTDNGLSVAINAFSTNATTAFTIGTGTYYQVQNTITKGDWVESVAFTTTATSGTHTATIKINNGGSTVAGTTLVTLTSGLWTATGTSTGTVTAYVDTGLTTITSPLTVYVSVT